MAGASLQASNSEGLSARNEARAIALASLVSFAGIFDILLNRTKKVWIW